MRIGLIMLLLAGSVSIVSPLVADEPRTANAMVVDSEAFPAAEQNGIVATLIEESFSRSPDGKYVVTSFLFMVENRNEKPGRHSHRSLIRIFSSQGEL